MGLSIGVGVGLSVGIGEGKGCRGVEDDAGGGTRATTSEVRVAMAMVKVIATTDSANALFMLPSQLVPQPHESSAGVCDSFVFPASETLLF